MTTWKELKDNPGLKKNYTTRLLILKLIREFFWLENFKEVETPLAVRYPGQEPHLNPISINIHDPIGTNFQFYLQTSPELSMKKLLAAGFDKIFQITKCFRDFEALGDGTHNTEFTMIEWYRAPGSLELIMDDAERLFKYVLEQLQITKCVYQSKEVAMSDVWDRRSMKSLWQQYIGVNLDEYLTTVELFKLLNSKGYSAHQNDSYEDLFFKIFLNEIETHLGIERPMFVYDYPKQMCSLSRLSKQDNRYAERAELYVGGLEIANGFGELVDSVEQKKHLEQDRDERIKLSKPTWGVDPGFIAALEAGVPEAGGIALGIDRMVMLCTGASNINDVIFQTINDQLT